MSRDFSQIVDYPSEDMSINAGTSVFSHTHSAASQEIKLQKSFDMFTTAQLRELVEPSMRPVSSCLDDEELVNELLRGSSSSGSRGELNRAFKFGGAAPHSRSSSSVGEEEDKVMSLSDIIPSPAHARSLSIGKEDDSVMKSIMAQATDVAPAVPRPRLTSNASSKRFIGDLSTASEPCRFSRYSALSFVGFDSFDEVRRGFEFHDQRPAFYPPPSAVPRYMRPESTFSLASISSLGHVVNPGVPDPFDYGDYSFSESDDRPLSEALDFSMAVDDTFEFHSRARRQRKRASNASSFYSRPQAHRRNSSNVAMFPPVSVNRYSRNFGMYSHGRNESSTSINSMKGRRSSWARHRRDASMDSIASDFSVMRLGRPGVGDKMFNTDNTGPLAAISASPAESFADSRYENRFSYDSVLDAKCSSAEDSMFDSTGRRSSTSGESIFGHKGFTGRLLGPPVYRPLSVLSFNDYDRSLHSPREDDTMISVRVLCQSEISN